MFDISIHIKKDIRCEESTEIASYDDDDFVDSLLMEICDYLHKIDIISFTVSGFSGMRWPVDVGTDLSTIIPEVPDLLLNLERRMECNLQFYEQGIERDLIFNFQKENVLITCLSLFGIPVTSEVEKIELNKLIKMLENLMMKFIKIAKCACPSITNHHLFKVWELQCHGISRYLNQRKDPS